jgi:hypothetical protein
MHQWTKKNDRIEGVEIARVECGKRGLIVTVKERKSVHLYLVHALWGQSHVRYVCSLCPEVARSLMHAMATAVDRIDAVRRPAPGPVPATAVGQPANVRDHVRAERGAA